MILHKRVSTSPQDNLLTRAINALRHPLTTSQGNENCVRRALSNLIGRTIPDNEWDKWREILDVTIRTPLAMTLLLPFTRPIQISYLLIETYNAYNLTAENLQARMNNLNNERR